jgi:hypothetical protein
LAKRESPIAAHKFGFTRFLDATSSPLLHVMATLFAITNTPTGKLAGSGSVSAVYLRIRFGSLYPFITPMITPLSG